MNLCKQLPEIVTFSYSLLAVFTSYQMPRCTKTVGNSTYQKHPDIFRPGIKTAVGRRPPFSHTYNDVNNDMA